MRCMRDVIREFLKFRGRLSTLSETQLVTKHNLLLTQLVTNLFSH